MYEDQNLTALLNKLEINQEVPPQMYTMVAEVLAFVYQLNKMAKKRREVQKRYSKKTGNP
jgi:flagellar biosynthesis protein